MTVFTAEDYRTSGRFLRAIGHADIARQCDQAATQADELTRLRTALDARERVIAGITTWLTDRQGDMWMDEVRRCSRQALAELARLTAELTGEPR